MTDEALALASAHLAREPSDRVARRRFGHLAAAAVHAAAAREKVGVACSAATLALLPPAGEKGALAHKQLPPAEPIAGADEAVAVYELVREAAK